MGNKKKLWVALAAVVTLLLAFGFAMLFADGKEEPAQVQAAFELRLLALSGFEPLADGCAVCGCDEPQAPMLDVVRGIVHCGSCKEPGGLSLPLTNAALAAMQHVLSCPAKRLYSFTLDAPQLRILGQASEAFVAAQLERSFRTLDYYKAILPHGGM